MFKDDWDDNDIPLAYLLTFRTYGTWLHGDERGSVDTHNHKNIFGMADIAPNENLKKKMKEKMSGEAFLLNEVQRKVVEAAIQEFCQFKKIQLHAVNARSNHVHAVISAHTKPETIINFLKSYSTRKLRGQWLIPSKTKPWSRGGSRRYLWKERHVSLAVEYVLYGQGDFQFQIDT